MAYPAEQEHVEYLDYLERWSLGQESGPKLSKEEWRTRKKQQSQSIPVKNAFLDQ